jgi:hypothetical protein
VVTSSPPALQLRDGTGNVVVIAVVVVVIVVIILDIMSC